MEEVKDDQVAADIAKEGDKSDEQKSEGTVEPITAEKAYELAQGLQKGYTMTRQDIAEIRENLNVVLETINSQKEKEGENAEEYLTVGKLREILSEQGKIAETKTAQTDSYIDGTLTQLRAEGVIKNDEEQEELIKFAISKKEPDLLKASERWQEIKQAREEGKKDVVKKETRQAEGSKVGTSSKGSEGSKGVNYATIHNTDWSHF